MISQTSLHHLSVSVLLPQTSTWSQDRGRIWKLFRSHLDLVESPATEAGSHLDWKITRQISVSGSIGTLCNITTPFHILKILFRRNWPTFLAKSDIWCPECTARGGNLGFLLTILHTLSIFVFVQQVCCTFRRFCRVLIWSEASGMQAICITLRINLLKGNRCL